MLEEGAERLQQVALAAHAAMNRRSIVARRIDETGAEDGDQPEE